MSQAMPRHIYEQRYGKVNMPTHVSTPPKTPSYAPPKSPVTAGSMLNHYETLHRQLKKHLSIKQSEPKPSENAIVGLVFLINTTEKHGKLLEQFLKGNPQAVSAISSPILSEELSKDIDNAAKLLDQLMILEPRKNGQDVIEVISPAAELANSVVADAVISATKAKEAAQSAAVAIAESASANQIQNSNIALMAKFADIVAAVVGAPTVREVSVGISPSSRNLDAVTAQKKAAVAHNNTEHIKRQVVARIQRLLKDAVQTLKYSNSLVVRLSSNRKSSPELSLATQARDQAKLVAEELSRLLQYISRCCNAIQSQAKKGLAVSASGVPALSVKDSVSIKGAEKASADLLKQTQKSSVNAQNTLVSAKQKLAIVPAPKPSVSAQIKPTMPNQKAVLLQRLAAEDRQTIAIKQAASSGRISSQQATAELQKIASRKAAIERALGSGAAFR